MPRKHLLRCQNVGLKSDQSEEVTFSAFTMMNSSNLMAGWKNMQNEIFLQELEEICGCFNGISLDKIFFKINIGNTSILLEGEAKNRNLIEKMLKSYRNGEKVAVMRVNGEFHVRTCRSGES